jgi:hypothetical protein
LLKGGRSRLLFGQPSRGTFAFGADSGVGYAAAYPEGLGVIVTRF